MYGKTLKDRFPNNIIHAQLEAYLLRKNYENIDYFSLEVCKDVLHILKRYKYTFCIHVLKIGAVGVNKKG